MKDRWVSSTDVSNGFADHEGMKDRWVSSTDVSNGFADAGFQRKAVRLEGSMHRSTP